MKKDEVKHIPKAEIAKAEPQTITVEVPTQIDTRNGMRQEIAYLQMLMRRYPGPAKRFADDMKLT